MPRLILTVVSLVAVVACPVIAHAQGAGAVRTVWTGAEDGATISPDGKLVAFIDWTTGDVAVRDVSTGTAVRLTDKGLFAGSRGFPEPGLIFSPGGDRIVFAFGNPQAGEPFRYELRLAGLDTTIQQVLAAYPPEVEFVAPLDWRADVGILFTTVAADASSELLIMQPDDRQVRLVERRPPGSGIIRQAFFTRDGDAVVHLANGRVRVVSSEGGVSYAPGVDAEALLGWSGDGRKLLFHGARDAVIGNWSIPFGDGRAVGEPTLERTTAAGVLPAGQSLEGVAFLEPAAWPGLFVVQLDLEAGRVARAPEEIALPGQGVPGNPAWSRGGGRLAFTLRDENRSMHRIMVSEGLRGPVREVARVDLRVMGLDWSADGRFLIVGGRADTRQLAWVGRADFNSGVVERLVMAPANAVAAGANEEVAYVRAAPAGERTVRVSVLSHPGATPRVLTTYIAAELPRSMSVSPDGKWMALVKPVDGGRASVLLLLPLAGGEPRTLMRLERPDALELNVGSLPWTADGRRVLVPLRRQGQCQLAAVHVESGELTIVPFSPRRAGRWQPALHQDGRQLVYIDGDGRSDLKLMSDQLRDEEDSGKRRRR
jgi:Tol biopolymer transport system component